MRSYLSKLLILCHLLFGLTSVISLYHTALMRVFASSLVNRLQVGPDILSSKLHAGSGTDKFTDIET